MGVTLPWWVLCGLGAGPTWPGSWSLPQPLQAVLEAREAREAVVPPVGQHGLGVGEHAGQTGGGTRGDQRSQRTPTQTERTGFNIHKGGTL